MRKKIVLALLCTLLIGCIGAVTTAQAETEMDLTSVYTKVSAGIEYTAEGIHLTGTESSPNQMWTNAGAYSFDLPFTTTFRYDVMPPVGEGIRKDNYFFLSEASDATRSIWINPHIATHDGSL